LNASSKLFIKLYEITEFFLSAISIEFSDFIGGSSLSSIFSIRGLKDLAISSEGFYY